MVVYINDFNLKRVHSVFVINETTMTKMCTLKVYVNNIYIAKSSIKKFAIENPLQWMMVYP